MDLVGGVAILGFAFGYLRGVRGGGGRRVEANRRPVPGRPAPPVARLAAGAGVATHLPGLFYLLGLDVIAAEDPGAVDGIDRVV